MGLRQRVNALIAWASLFFLFYTALLFLHDLAPFLPPSLTGASSLSPVIHLIFPPLSLSLQTQMSVFLLTLSTLRERHLHFLAEKIQKEGKSKKCRGDSADSTESMEGRGVRESLWVF